MNQAAATLWCGRLAITQLNSPRGPDQPPLSLRPGSASASLFLYDVEGVQDVP